MFARVNLNQIDVEKVSAAIQIWEESIIPAAKLQKGFCGAYLLTDRKLGKGMGITFWESEEDAIANEQSGYYRDQLSKFKGVFIAPPIHVGYDVSVKVQAD
ncbi:antibiotic biosynthesis monooxygenase family protein [Chloroflexota bacterium]